MTETQLETSPEESGEVSPAEVTDGFDQDAFNTRVQSLMELIAEDPANRDRMLCEVYVTVAEFHQSFREMQNQVAQIGPKGMLKALLGRG